MKITQERIAATGKTGTIIGNMYDGRGFLSKLFGGGDNAAAAGFAIELDEPEFPYSLQRVGIIVKDFRAAGFPQHGEKVTLDLLAQVDSQGFVHTRATNVARLNAA